MSFKILDKTLKPARSESIFSEKCHSNYLAGISLYIGNNEKFYQTYETTEREKHGEALSTDEGKTAAPSSLEDDVNHSGLICTTCSEAFDNLQNQRYHFKSDWHKFNVKQKASQRKVLAEEEFETYVEGKLSNIPADLSSISGSDSDSDYEERSKLLDESEDNTVEETRNNESLQNAFLNHPYKFFFTSNNILFSLYRNAVQNHKNNLDTATLKQLNYKGSVWIYLMLSGGHFAAAVFKENMIVAHKTFHRYTIRAKRGTTQSAHDNKSGGKTAPNSAGASLRRHNEAALAQDIHNLLNSWQAYIKEATKIFYRCSIHNTGVIFNDKTPLKRDDHRLVKISVMVRRPILKEVKRIHNLFSTMEVYGNVNDIEGLLSRNYHEHHVTKTTTSNNKNEHFVKNNKESPKVETKKGTHLKDKSSKISSKKMLPKPNESVVDSQIKESKTEDTGNKVCRCPPIENDGDLTFWKYIRNKLYNDCTKENFDELFTNSTMEEKLIESRNLFREKKLINFCCKHETDTLLHVVSQLNRRHLVTPFLLLGADPTVRNFEGKLPYHASGKKETRNEYRKFMAKYPDNYDYQKADIPGPLTESEEAEQNRKAAEKKKRQNQQRKAKKKAERMKEMEAEELQKEKSTFDSLSDREKRAAMAERRFASQLTNALKCANCRQYVPDEKKAFRRYEFLYCSTDCVFKHKSIIGK